MIDEFPDVAKKMMLKIDGYLETMVEPHFRGTDAIAYSIWAKSGFITPWVRTWDDNERLNGNETAPEPLDEPTELDQPAEQAAGDAPMR